MTTTMRNAGTDLLALLAPVADGGAAAPPDAPLAVPAGGVAPGPAGAPPPLDNMMLGCYPAATKSGGAATLRRFRLAEIAQAVLDGANPYGAGGTATLAERTERYRELAAADGRAKGSPSERFKKDGMPAMTLSGVFAGQRQGEWPVNHTGLYQVDLDKVEAGDAPALRDAAGALPYVVLAFVSPSAMGVKVVVRGAPPRGTEIAEHKAQWEAANRAVCGALGIEFGDDKRLDEKVSSVNGLCFWGYDPDAIWRPDAEALAYAHPLAPPAPSGNGTGRAGAAAPSGGNGRAYDPNFDIGGGWGPDVALDALRFIDPPPEDVTEWVALVYAAKRAGIAMGDVEDWSSRGVKYVQGEIAARWHRVPLDGAVSAGTIFHVARERGWRGGRRETRLDAPGPEPEPDDDNPLLDCAACGAPVRHMIAKSRQGRCRPCAAADTAAAAERRRGLGAAGKMNRAAALWKSGDVQGAERMVAEARRMPDADGVAKRIAAFDALRAAQRADAPPDAPGGVSGALSATTSGIAERPLPPAHPPLTSAELAQAELVSGAVAASASAGGAPAQVGRPAPARGGDGVASGGVPLAPPDGAHPPLAPAPPPDAAHYANGNGNGNGAHPHGEPDDVETYICAGSCGRELTGDALDGGGCCRDCRTAPPDADAAAARLLAAPAAAHGEPDAYRDCPECKAFAPPNGRRLAQCAAPECGAEWDSREGTLWAPALWRRNSAPAAHNAESGGGGVSGALSATTSGAAPPLADAPASGAQIGLGGMAPAGVSNPAAVPCRVCGAAIAPPLYLHYQTAHGFTKAQFQTEVMAK